MTVADQLKNFRQKNDLDSKTAKISALSSRNVDKYEYLTGEDLDYNPILFKKTKFEYSLLGKFFNKKLNEEDKKEGVLEF